MKSVQPRSQTGELVKDQHYLVVESGKARYAGKFDLMYHAGTGDGMENVYRFTTMENYHHEVESRWREARKHFIPISEEELEEFRKL